MKTSLLNSQISVSEARSNFSFLVSEVQRENKSAYLWKRNMPVVKIVPISYDEKYNEVTNINSMGGSFDFLLDEPDLYTAKDVKYLYDVEKDKLIKK